MTAVPHPEETDLRFVVHQRIVSESAIQVRLHRRYNLKVVVESIQVGRPQAYNNEDGECWISAIEKRPVKGAVEVRTNNIVGDEQSDHVHHGGIDKAVLAYSSDHFEFWRRRLADQQIGCGAFGENLTVAGVTVSFRQACKTRF